MHINKAYKPYWVYSLCTVLAISSNIPQASASWKPRRPELAELALRRQRSHTENPVPGA